jgi:uncharacterized phage protein gp47/JayE
LPWTTPTLIEVRGLVRDSIRAKLPGADAAVPNSVMRVLADVQGGQCFTVLEYIDWLANQLLPDSAETEWLDRHGNIWLVNSDNTIGRKGPTFASGTVNFTGTPGVVIPIGTQVSGSNVTYETTEEITLDSVPTPARVVALDAGTQGNQVIGATMRLVGTISGVTDVTVVNLTGGTDIETDDDLRIRVLLRIRNPPMGGDATDYQQWALAVPGVTRAWASPLEQGMGTVTIRFMCDDLRAAQDGFPQPEDIVAVKAYLDSKRPVAVKDFFVVAPIPEPISFTIENLVPETSATRAAITDSVSSMLKARAAPAYAKDGVAQPAQTIYAAWVSAAISDAPDVESFRLIMDDHVMPNAGSLAVLGTISYI